MYPTENYTTDDIDVNWQRFEQTGSVLSYLKYKGVDLESTTTSAHTSNENKDGEPVGYR